MPSAPTTPYWGCYTGTSQRTWTSSSPDELRVGHCTVDEEEEKGESETEVRRQRIERQKAHQIWRRLFLLEGGTCSSSSPPSAAADEPAPDTVLVDGVRRRAAVIVAYGDSGLRLRHVA